MNYTLEELNNTGIYSILNLVNGKQYIGSTTQSFKLRWYQHKRDLRNNKHYSKYLQHSWNKYTEEMFQFIIIEYCEPDQCLIREQHYLDSLNVCDKEFGYNNCLIAGSVLGRKVSEETRAKIGLAHAGRKHSDEFRARLKIISTGRIFSDATRSKISLANAGIKRSPETIVKMCLAQSNNKAGNKTYIVTDPNGLEITTNNLKEFCKINDLEYTRMSKTATGKAKHHKGWKCKHQ